MGTKKCKGNVVRKINDALMNVGSGASPLLRNLVLYNSSVRKIVKDGLVSLFENTEKNTRDIYEKNILPKMGNVFESMTGHNVYLPKRKNGVLYFSKRSPESIRKKVRDSYRGQFGLDEITAMALFSEEPMSYPYGKGGKFSFTNNNYESLISYRHKSEESKRKKHVSNFRKLGMSERKYFWNFLKDISENNYSFLRNMDKYTKQYGKNICDCVLYDSFGTKIVDLNQERSEKNMNCLIKKGKNLNLHNFDVISVKDHLDRTEKSRPGGIHYTLVDKAFPSYPVEVQLRGIKDEIFNIVGENASMFYDFRGKKDNINLR